MKNKVLACGLQIDRRKTVRTACGLICAAFCLFLAVPESRAASICTTNPSNLVVNCGFETGDFTGWTLSGNDVPGELNNLYGVEGVDPLDGISPNSGMYQAYFDDLVANATTLSQTITTVPGVTYHISFYVAQDTAIVPPYSNQLSGSFGGVAFPTLTAIPVEGYTLYQDWATATSSSSVLSLKLGNDLGQFLVDDATVVVNPEPPSWMLGLGGLTMVCMFRRMRRGIA
jgi:hypothetical protein